MIISLVVAMSRNCAIGNAGGMPWHLPADLKHFKRITMDKPIIMGRKTYDSIGRALPGRLNIVITRDKNWQADEVYVAHSVDDALRAAAEYEEVMIIGGANLYEQLLPNADRLYITEIDAEFPADTYFPAIDTDDWQETARETREADEKNPYRCNFVTLERKKRQD